MNATVDQLPATLSPTHPAWCSHHNKFVLVNPERTTPVKMIYFVFLTLFCGIFLKVKDLSKTVYD